MTYEYDTRVNILYIRLKKDNIIERQIEIENGTIVDVDSRNRPIGIEIISPDSGWDMEPIEHQISLKRDEFDYVKSLHRLFSSISQNSKYHPLTGITSDVRITTETIDELINISA